MLFQNELAFAKPLRWLLIASGIFCDSSHRYRILSPTPNVMLDPDNDATAELLTLVSVTCYLRFKALNNDPMFRRRCVGSAICRVNVSDNNVTQPTFY